MAQTGRPPKPLEQKKRLGNPGKRALKEVPPLILLPAVNTVPDPHRPLLGTPETPQAGRILWRRIWESGAGWLNLDVDSELIMIVCEQADERFLLRVKLFRNEMDWRDRAALRSLEKLITDNLSSLGFNPVDRTRLVTAAPVSQLSQFRERLAAKKQSPAS